MTAPWTAPSVAETNAVRAGEADRAAVERAAAEMIAALRTAENRARILEDLKADAPEGYDWDDVFGHLADFADARTPQEYGDGSALNIAREEMEAA